MIQQGSVVQEIPGPYEMGVDFIAHNALPDVIPYMREPVFGWSVYSGCEGETPDFDDFFVDKARAQARTEERDTDGDLVLYDAFVFEAILLPEGLVTSNDFEVDTHEKLARRINEWRARGWDGTS